MSKNKTTEPEGHAVWRALGRTKDTGEDLSSFLGFITGTLETAQKAAEREPDEDQQTVIFSSVHLVKMNLIMFEELAEEYIDSQEFEAGAAPHIDSFHVGVAKLQSMLELILSLELTTAPYDLWGALDLGIDSAIAAHRPLGKLINLEVTLKAA